MAESRRVLLQTQLETLLGSDQVYFNPPETISLTYPAIVYSLSSKYVKPANNHIYRLMDCYDLTYMHKDPDDQFPNLILSEFPYSRYDRQAVVKNLYNDYLTLYF